MLGIFDSGSGGLSVLTEIRKRLPKIDVVYLGDIKNAPYGNRSREELGALTIVAINRLLKEGADKIVSACNSVSGSIVLSMLEILNVKVFDMIEMVGPTVKKMQKSKGNILLVATKATVDSGIYQNGFLMSGKKVSALPIEELASAIEFGATREELEKIITKALEGQDRFDHLILGCTHYPLVEDVFTKVLSEMGRKVVIFDPAEAVADEVKVRMTEGGEGRIRFLITKDSSFFRERVEKMFGNKNVTIEVL